MNKIHIFNPDHDYALSIDGPWFTPPASIMNLIQSEALLPLNWASEGDAILLPSLKGKEILISEVQREKIEKLGITLLTWENIGDFSALHNDFILAPWGWNLSLVSKLIKAGVPKYLIPSQETIIQIRNLSHRRTASEFNKSFAQISAKNDILKPFAAIEFFNVNDALSFYEEYNNSFFKAPWSSSGRGILSCHDLELKHIEPWLRGIIKRQGSVMGETFFDKTIDFASEWICRDGEAEFIGYSLFKTSSRGKFHKNIILPQEDLLDIILSSIPEYNTNVIDIQKNILDTMISKNYSGPLGIDMMGNKTGQIRPCVEINLRMTMGHAAILKSKS